MSIFINCLGESSKELALKKEIEHVRSGETSSRIFNVEPKEFSAVPGSPFAYWVGDSVRSLFKRFKSFESESRTVRQGLATTNDFRYVRAPWEISVGMGEKWFPMAKGGKFSSFYCPFFPIVNWSADGAEIKAEICQRYPYLNGNPGFVAKNTDYYFRAGVTWPLRTHRYCPQALPEGTVISVRGSGIYSKEPAVYLALFSATIVDFLLKMQSGRFEHPQFDMGDVSVLPVPALSDSQTKNLAYLGTRGWQLKRYLDSVVETSYAFSLPSVLRPRVGEFSPFSINQEVEAIHNEIDNIAFEIYGLNESDRLQIGMTVAEKVTSGSGDFEIDDDDGVEGTEADDQTDLMSWCVGVAFGRFDWHLATGNRAAPTEPTPFAPLPAKSPGMLQDGTNPFHNYAGILVDDQGHQHDLTRLVEEVLDQVGMLVPDDVRRWLQRDFFAFHLQRYSKSRRKAPIYWPLATASGSYTLWVYCPSLSSQTLYTAINDFVEPKLKEVGAGGTALRNKGSARTRDEETQFETLQAFELELIELRDTLLGIAQGYQPNHDDGVQITAAPLWPLFRHKPWQKVLKDTWAKLEKGDYDWSHLAMSYWPARVREKCKTDKSLAIAHDLEALYVEPEAKLKKTRAAKGAGK